MSTEENTQRKDAPPAQGPTTTESYTYDPVGNRLSDLTTSGWSNNASNELVSRPGVSYTFDNNGNELTKLDSTGTTSYAWDYENRLTGVTLPGNGGTVSFKYDPFGRRIEKISPTATSIFAYDGDGVIETTNPAGAVTSKYAQGQAIDEPLAQSNAGATTYYEAGGLGSVTSLTNAAGALAQTYTFDSFGKETASSGSVTNPFQYTAREFDAETGLYYYRARYYDPSAGRFLSEDPLGFSVGTNFYRYVGNSPINAADPTGLRTLHFGGMVVNLSKCCVLVSSNDEDPHQEHQYWIPPGGSSGPYSADVDAIYFPNGSALKIPDFSLLIVTKCFGPGDPKMPLPFPTGGGRLSPKFLPNAGAIQQEFGHPVKPPATPCKNCS